MCSILSMLVASLSSKSLRLGNLPFLIGFFHSMTTDISVLRTDKLQDYTDH